MKTWVIYALVSAAFAGFTSVIAKIGLSGITAELGLAVRTGFVALFVLGFAAWAVVPGDISKLSRANVMWLGVSGVTTALSWIYYYKALKSGEVSTVALIDKGSFLVAVLLAWIVLKESMTPRIVAGSLLILAGLYVVSRR
jgi:bacterial/archaeal transporter family protein